MAIIHLGISLEFSTASEIPVQTITAQAQKIGPWKPATLQIEYVNDRTINALFETVADVVESILNELCMAQAMTGREGRAVEALNLKNIKEMTQ
jgi:L-aminopeptidase/D-esterase-like protein